MALHLIKLSVGSDSVEDLAAWQSERLRQMKRDGIEPELFHRTFQMPKRRDELLDGGSIYWVIKGIVQARQRLLDLREGTRDDGTPCTLLILDKTLVPVRPAPRRATFNAASRAISAAARDTRRSSRRSPMRALG